MNVLLLPSTVFFSVLQVTLSLPLVLTLANSGVLLGEVVLLTKRLALYVAVGASTLQSNLTSEPAGIVTDGVCTAAPVVALKLFILVGNRLLMLVLPQADTRNP